MTDPSAIVLAAGEGMRLRPLTRNRPKPMLPVCSRPILERVFDQLVEIGITDITVVVGYRRHRVQSHFGPTYRNVPVSYVTQEPQLGTGDAILAAESAVEGTCLVVYGDQFVDGRILRDVVDGHDGAAATLGLLRRTDVSGYGGVLLDGDRVVEMVEHPADDREYLLNAGAYVLESRAFDAVRAAEPRAGEHLLVDGISRLVDEGATVRGVVSDGVWADATYPWDLLDVSETLLEAGVIDDDRTVGVDRSAKVHESATVREPVVVGPDCEIGPGAVIGPKTCLGENATVGSGAVVERSVIDADTRIGANATVIDCVTGVGVEIGPGTTIPGGPGDVRVGDRVFEDERLGALVADRARDRGGASYVPGAIVGAGATVESGAVVRGTITDGTEVRS